MRVVILVERNAHLLEVVLTLGSSRRLSSGLHRRQQKPNQNADDGYHHQQLNERETM